MEEELSARKYIADARAKAARERDVLPKTGVTESARAQRYYFSKRV